MPGALSHLVEQHGYWLVALLVGLESMGVPAPGETVLVSAAVYAGTTRQLSIMLVIAAAAVGAIVGDNVGYLLGHRFGARLLERYGHLIRVDSRRIRLGRYLFDRHGGWVVFLGRFVALLRTLSALLAGINRMHWKRFLIFNAAGGIIWALIFGSAGYTFGEALHRFTGPLAVFAISAAVIAFVVGVRFVAHHEAALQAEADRAQ